MSNIRELLGDRYGKVESHFDYLKSLAKGINHQFEDYYNEIKIKEFTQRAVKGMVSLILCYELTHKFRLY